MSKTKRVKIGMAGLMTRPFRGPKETYFAEDSQEMRKIVQDLECDLIIVEKGIYDLTTAKEAASEFLSQEVDLVILQNSSLSGGDFILPFLEINSHIALWAIPEGNPTSEGGLPLNSFTGMNLYNSIIKTRKKSNIEPVKWFFGRANEPDFKERFESLIRAIYAEINLHEARIGLIGGVAQGFSNLIVDQDLLKLRIGANLVEVDLESIYALADSISDMGLINHHYQKMIKQTKTYSASMEKFFQSTARFQAAFEIFSKQNDLDAVAVSCWPSFQTDRQLGVCTLMGQLNDAGLVSACEGDIPGALGMLTLNLLSQGKVTTIMDMVTIDREDDSILLWHCGPTAPSLADENGVAMQSLWLFDNDPHAPLGLHNNLRIRPGQATVLGFYPDFSQLLVFEGELDNKKPSYTGSSAWMRDLHMHGKPISNMDLIQTIMDSGYQHHYPLAHGKYEKPAHDLAHLLGMNIINTKSY